MCCNNRCKKTEKPSSKETICQSCVMPMVKTEDFGTNADKSKNTQYCCYCFQEGNFTEPELTLEQMLQNCSSAMKEMEMPEAQIEQIKKYIPTLKRWQK